MKVDVCLVDVDDDEVDRESVDAPHLRRRHGDSLECNVEHHW